MASGIPYIRFAEIPWLGVDTFWTLVVVGVTSSFCFAYYRARQYEVPARTILTFIAFVALPSVLASDLLQPLLYQPRKVISDPSIILRPFGGMSSFAGAIGFLIFFPIYLRLFRPAVSWRVFADISVQSWVAGWVFGRLGCAIVHDHPGKRTSFPFAVQYPEGLRHDLGLYEWLFTILILVPVSIYIHRSKQPAGTQLAVVALMYGPFRLFADSLRVNEFRYLHWTPGQYCAAILIVIGYAVAARLRAEARGRTSNNQEIPSNSQ